MHKLVWHADTIPCICISCDWMNIIRSAFANRPIALLIKFLCNSIKSKMIRSTRCVVKEFQKNKWSARGTISKVISTENIKSNYSNSIRGNWNALCAVELAPRIRRTIHYSFHLINKTTRISVLGSLEHFKIRMDFDTAWLNYGFTAFGWNFTHFTRWLLSVCLLSAVLLTQKSFHGWIRIRYAFHYYCIRSKWRSLCTQSRQTTIAAPINIYELQWVINLFVHSFATHLFFRFLPKVLNFIAKKNVEFNI